MICCEVDIKDSSSQERSGANDDSLSLFLPGSTGFQNTLTQVNNRQREATQVKFTTVVDYFNGSQSLRMRMATIECFGSCEMRMESCHVNSGKRSVDAVLSLMSVPGLRDAPRDEKTHGYFDFKQLRIHSRFAPHWYRRPPFSQ